MTDTTDQDRKKLSLGAPRGKLTIGKSAETSQVRQSFSHGRTETVQVERKRKRLQAPPGSPGGRGDGDGSGRTLTAEERAARTRALMGLKEQEAARAAATVPTSSADAAAESDHVEAAPAEAAPPVELDRRQTEGEEAPF